MSNTQSFEACRDHTAVAEVLQLTATKPTHVKRGPRPRGPTRVCISKLKIIANELREGRASFSTRQFISPENPTAMPRRVRRSG